MVLSLLVLPGLAAFTGPQDDPQPPCRHHARRRELAPKQLQSHADEALAEALARLKGLVGQAAQAEAAAAAARSDTDSPAADGSATTADTPPPPARSSLEEGMAIVSTMCL